MKQQSVILIVDDEPSARETVEGLLSPEDFTLVFANNGSEALAGVEEHSPDVILLDVMMPEMDGFEVCERLKTDLRWRHIPIIMLTALGSREDLVRGIDAGADDFVTKPVVGLELRARVRSMLRIKEQHDQVEEQRREMELIHNIGLQMVNNLNPDYLVKMIGETALELNPQATHCVMHFLSDDGQKLAPVVFTAKSDGKRTGSSVGFEEIVRESIEIREAVYVRDLLVTSSYLKLKLDDIRTLLVTPLIVDGRPIGTLSIASAEIDAFKENRLRAMSILANQGAIAIMKARLLEDLKQTSTQEKWMIRSLFQRYVSPAVVDKLVDGTEDLALGGKRQELSLLFADLRGFTAFSEHLAPERLIEVLNSYLSLAADAILAEAGTLDKFVGDSVMALFNAPLTQPDHALKAVRAALAMRKAIAAHNSQTANGSRLSFGIGIHSGAAVVGNIGTLQQMNYTAIGDTVNLAQRLQEKAKGGQIILSQATYEAVKKVAVVEELGPLSIRGRSAPEQVYLLLDLK